MRTTSMRSHIRYASCEGRTPSGVLASFCASLSTDPLGLRQSFDSDVQAPKKYKRSALIMPNQINTESFVNPECLSKERIQAWIDAMADSKRYCFYIAVGLADSDITYPLGNWNIPFYSIEEANQFKNEAQLKYPDYNFDFITGTLRIDQAMEDVSCVFWDKWQKKHNERISLLDNKKAVSL